MTQPSLRLSQVRTAFEIGNGVAGLGDSITASDAQNSTGLIGSGGWLVQACMRAPDRLRFVRNAGVSGERTDQMLARIDADVIAYAPDRCFVLGGVNDLKQGVPVATVRANLLAIYNRLRATGIGPILCTLTPYNNSGVPALIDQLNAWIRWIASRRGYPLCDFEAVTLTPLTADWRSGYSDDGLHPNSVGTTAMATQVVTTIAPLFAPAAPYTAKSFAGGSPASILTNGLFLTDVSLDGVADGWTGVNVTTNATPSLVADDGHVFGQWQQLVVATTGVKYFERNTSSAWSVGDRIAFSGKVSTIGAVAGSLKVTAKLRFINGASPVQLVPIYQLTKDVTDWVWYAEAVIPAGTTVLTVDLQVDSGTGTVRWGEVSVVNMTTQGFV